MQIKKANSKVVQHVFPIPIKKAIQFIYFNFLKFGPKDLERKNILVFTCLKTFKHHRLYFQMKNLVSSFSHARYHKKIFVKHEKKKRYIYKIYIYIYPKKKR